MTRAMSKPDPIFALIEAHRVAEQAFEIANKRNEDLLFRVQKNPERHGQGADITNDTPRYYIAIDMGAITSDPRESTLSPNEQIEKHITRYLDNGTHPYGPKTKAKIKALHRSAVHELRALHKAFLVEHDKKRVASGLAASAQALEEAENASSRALRKLCSTVPVTAAGTKAMLEYLAPICGGELEGLFADGRTDALWRTLIKAVGAQR